ncbi:aminotransferase class V-fold PLP-dependent enzyme [Puia sp. P3]|uniref:aminotransferase class V-fold PLP-dependent enzyme n=1 Tax=Puia sp. P3 TaxID=3423952 RepID=UPI003D66C702
MKHPIYLDNAATTALSPEALEAMMPFLTESFGNPSSIYSIGRSTRVAVEMAEEDGSPYSRGKADESVLYERRHGK